jgi:hypothetical protein
VIAAIPVALALGIVIGINVIGFGAAALASCLPWNRRRNRSNQKGERKWQDTV